jgi:hypothetical protein
MTTKRASLFSVAAAPVPAAPAADTPAETPVDPPRKYPVAATRAGKRVASAYLTPEALRQLKRLAMDEEATVQDLLVEGINAVFEKRGLSRIA